MDLTYRLHGQPDMRQEVRFGKVIEEIRRKSGGNNMGYNIAIDGLQEQGKVPLQNWWQKN